ncbi:Phosphoglucomutase-1 [Plutella xylostella]|uniref:phosphoglucomutase (alpha-D-glucose-1,6-bisphosphate-dependent) n=1 Tax=Plutella xylostella TaxID=51655 RepID=A0ABQ7R5A5_PLUXY|nr:Phosphoglucomutase-1 [Plutella xylostella]
MPGIVTVNTSPYEGQKPGTSGLRKKVKVFLQENYTENFVQSILDANKGAVALSTLVVGGDGRYLVKEVVDKIIKICAGNGVSRLLVGQNGILSTPAVSCIIRKYKTLGGIVLTASHNPGGIDNDFGIKFNCANGGPAPDATTNQIHALTTQISQYKTVPDLVCPIDKCGVQKFDVEGQTFTVEVIDPVDDYLALMREIFDLPAIGRLLRGEGGRKFNVLIDGMNGVTGPYIQRIFVQELGAPPTSVRRVTPLEDFGGAHPDPNLTYAVELVEEVRGGDYDFGAAFDGDGDRNMIIGRNAFFVTPSDSLAVLAAGAAAVPYFRSRGVAGLARSMPTAAAADRVAKELGLPVFEVPTGWKYFGNLMDAGRLSICGEESFGTGSDHVREKDGIWAALFWLQVLAASGLSVEDTLKEHWRKFGRNYFTRYDYEECASAPCAEMMLSLERTITAPGFAGSVLTGQGKAYTVAAADDFSYMDPVDHSVAMKQGLRIIFTDGSRIVMRLSGTGSSGATVRLYIDSYEPTDVLGDAQDMLRPLVDIALQLSDLPRYTGRAAPTVIT